VPASLARIVCVGLVLWGAASARAQAPASGQSDSAAMQAAHAAEQESAMQAADAEARKHFQIGKLLLDSGRFQEATTEFEAAYKLSGRPQLLYNLYIAYRDAGNVDKAIESLRGYLDKVPDAPDRINLTARLASLEEQRKRQLEQAERARLASEEAERAKAEAAKRTYTVTDHSVVPWVVMGVGGALIVASVGTGVAALGKSKELEENCFDATSCPRSQEDNINKARALSTTTDVLWISGAATAVTGFVLWVTGVLDTERQVPISRRGVPDRLRGHPARVTGGAAITPEGVSTTLTARF
jgi:tetratricopeptide (TPR) repeat protein